MKFPVFDLHCDTALALLGDRYDSIGSLRQNTLHIDLERAKTLPGYAQCFACYTSPLQKLPQNLSVVGLFEREMAAILQETEQNSDCIQLAYSAKQIRKNKEKGIMSALLTIEGPAGFDYNADLLEDLYKIGFRMTTLGWNEDNPLTGSCVTGGGLTDAGREYVKEAQRLGMIVDVSHISDAGFWDIMEITQAPVIASHSNSRTLCDLSRNLTDDMFLQICRTGGVAGFNLYPDFIGEDGDLEQACRHFLHFMELDPSGKHIALGGDLDGVEKLPKGFGGVQDYPALAQVLSAHGLSDENLSDIFWNNAMGVIRKCCM